MANRRLERARRTLLLACASAALLQGCQRQGEWGKREQRRYLPNVSQLSSNTGDEFYFAFPAGIERRRFALLALESLDIGAGVTIRPTDPSFYTSVSSVLPPGYGAYVGSLGQLRIGDGAGVGSIYAWGNPATIGRGVAVAGYIKSAHGPFTSGAYSSLGMLTNSPPALARYAFAPPLAALTNSAPSRITREAGSRPLEVPPGVYNELVATDGATLRLSSGTYRARKLSIGQGAVVEISNADGPVELWVDEELVVNGLLEEQLLEPNILLMYAGRDSLILSQPFRGTLVAPRAEVTLLATDPPHVGAFYARKLNVAPKATIRHVTFFRELARPTPLAEVCDKCTTNARAEVASCQVGFQQLGGPREAYAECEEDVRAGFQRCLLDDHWRPGSCLGAGRW